MHIQMPFPAEKNLRDRRLDMALKDTEDKMVLVLQRSRLAKMLTIRIWRTSSLLNAFRYHGFKVSWFFNSFAPKMFISVGGRFVE